MSLREQRDYLDEQAWNRPQYGTGKGDNGSWPELGKRLRLLRNFANECRIWYEWRQSPCYVARRTLYNALVHRHGADAVLRWQPAIKAILDSLEAEARDAYSDNSHF